MCVRVHVWRGGGDDCPPCGGEGSSAPGLNSEARQCREDSLACFQSGGSWSSTLLGLGRNEGPCKKVTVPAGSREEAFPEGAGFAGSRQP
jgi:hypothetical protein